MFRRRQVVTLPTRVRLLSPVGLLLSAPPLPRGAGLAPHGGCLTAQLYFRDSTQPDGTGAGLSDAVTFAIEP